MAKSGNNWNWFNLWLSKWLKTQCQSDTDIHWQWKGRHSHDALTRWTHRHTLTQTHTHTDTHNLTLMVVSEQSNCSTKSILSTCYLYMHTRWRAISATDGLTFPILQGHGKNWLWPTQLGADIFSFGELAVTSNKFSIFQLHKSRERINNFRFKVFTFYWKKWPA